MRHFQEIVLLDMTLYRPNQNPRSNLCSTGSGIGNQTSRRPMWHMARASCLSKNVLG